MIARAACLKRGRLALFGMFFLSGPCSSFAKCGQAVSPDSLRYFIQQPSQVLEIFPIGGLGLRSTSELYVIASPETRIALASLIARANFRQKQAISYGFVGAYNACRFQEPSLARDIDSLARTVPDDIFVRMYLREVVGNEPPDVGRGSSGASDNELEA